MAEAFHAVHPKEFHKKFLEKEVRPDGRNLDRVRKTVIASGSLKSADGSALVKLGNSTVLCGLKLEVGVPHAVKPKAGRLEVSLHLSPLCSNKFSIGKATEQSVAIGQAVANLVSGSDVFDFNQLCIEQGKSVWVIFADIVCLDYDGSILDASLLALNSALQNLRLPETKVDEDGVVMMSEQKPNKLAINHTIVGTTFGFLDEWTIADPTAEEEDLLNGTCTIVYSSKGTLCSVYKPGGTPIPLPKLQRCLKLAKDRALEVAKSLQQ